MEENKIKNISYIYSLNFRIAKQIIGSSNNILNHILDFQNNNIYNTLIVGIPGTGKTTILKDLVRNVSNGFENFNRYNSWNCR